MALIISIPWTYGIAILIFDIHDCVVQKQYPTRNRQCPDIDIRVRIRTYNYAIIRARAFGVR